MAQIDMATFDSETTKSKSLPILNKSERPKRECRTRKRPYELEQYTSKRLKYDQIEVGGGDEQDENSCVFTLTNSDSEDENETEINDENKQLDDNSDFEDIEDETNYVQYCRISSDQQRYTPVVYNQTILQQQQSLTRHSKRLISQFKYFYDHGLRKSIQTTDCSSMDIIEDNADEKFRAEFKNTFNRLDLFKQGYCVLSNEPFAFYSLCYLCGSLGSNDLIYCQSCCEGYHFNCLNDYEQPRANLSSQNWLCPNCNVCTICGLLTSKINQIEPLISCYDCQKTFHLKCLKKTASSTDEQYIEIFQMTNNNSVVSQSRLMNSYLLNHIWFCPTCVHCDCGEKLYSNERNLLCLTRYFSTQMCFDCFNQLKILRIEKHDQIDKCLFCEKFIEQISTKDKSPWSLLRCTKCQYRFHSKCDGYFPEDLPILTQMKLNLICSKCDRQQHDFIRQQLNQIKQTILDNLSIDLSNIFQLISHQQIETYFQSLNKYHQKYFQSIHLEFFLNDLLYLIRRIFSSTDLQSWQGVIDGCIRRQCPWFQSKAYLTNIKSIHVYQPIPFDDHTYVKQNQYQLSTNSLLNRLENLSTNSFQNFHQNDTRKCQLCDTLSDSQCSIIGRLISFGINQWVHVGCILAAYAKNLDQPPYILRNIRETIQRCQNKYTCVLCSKLGASVHCFENECYQRFHCHCIQKYYAKQDQTYVQTLNIKNGFLPNLTTLCLKHNGLKTLNNDLLNDEEMKNAHSKIKYINPLSTVYGDLSNNTSEIYLNKIYLCIGSLQIESVGNFDYQINKISDNYIYNQTYPNDYRASRLFWSIDNPQKIIRYYLHIEVNQTYHTNEINHRIQVYPCDEKQMTIENLYEQCRIFFRKYQQQIDEHYNTIEELCQKTTVNKKGQANQANSKKKNSTTGTGTTRRIPKATPSCVKRQTPKAALKNVSRPRNRFANEKTLANSKPNETPSNLFANDYLKTTNVSQFALALVQALRHVGHSTKIQQDSNANVVYTTTDKTNNDILLKQLLKNITVPQQLNDSPTTDNTTKTIFIPQVDGSIDDDESDDLQITSSILNSLIEQITAERIRTDSANSMDLSDYITCPPQTNVTPISPAQIHESNVSFDVIKLYKQWLKTNFLSVKFTIRNDDGYETIADDLDEAWSEIIRLICHSRDDQNFEHIPMTNEQLNGHQMFGLTKPIVNSILTQLYANEQTNETICLPLSSISTNVNVNENNLKKNTNLIGSRSNVYERKTRERQRFGWLLNQSRKIDYAVKSFEIDSALYHARRILLEEASVSLRLYHLHYFSERALLVGSSPIHGCGLFTLVDLVEGQMIIEYTGEVVRPCLTDKRERENEGKGFGCYMFTVDSMNVIDATHRGNKARFINHNCQPNCFAKTVLSGGVKHIVIYALKDVPRGSELTYDYSFPEEDIKIPCHCGTTQCRVYLN